MRVSFLLIDAAAFRPSHMPHENRDNDGEVNAPTDDLEPGHLGHEPGERLEECGGDPRWVDDPIEVESPAEWEGRQPEWIGGKSGEDFAGSWVCWGNRCAGEGAREELCLLEIVDGVGEDACRDDDEQGARPGEERF